MNKKEEINLDEVIGGAAIIEIVDQETQKTGEKNTSKFSLNEILPPSDPSPVR
ncbi:MAG: hypothetical protein WCV63_11320 [Negativicutes bacterium]